MRVVALGGLDEVGRNMSVVEYNGKLIVMDCGVLFPEDDQQPGVDLILPDFSYLENRMQDIEAIVITHGHEDHIGALPFFLSTRENIPIVGSKLTLAFITQKLRQYRIKNPKTIEVKERDSLQLGDFYFEFIAVNHSIPDALAVYLKTPAGTIINTGDIKLDQRPLDGRITDLGEFARLGAKPEGVDLFMVDSTNAERKGFVGSESDIGGELDRLFANQEGKIVVASFSSQIHRVQQVVNTAVKHGRVVAMVGRSMIKNMKIAEELGYLKIPNGAVVGTKEIDSIPSRNIVVMCTGSQGESMAALSRMARGDHQILEVNEGDMIILASSLIPGNEKSVFTVINQLSKLGATVIHNQIAPVHVTGHAQEGELFYLYNTVGAKNVMPIHGESRHLRANASIAKRCAKPPKNVIVASNGTIIDIRNGKAKVVGETLVGYVFVDGSSVGEITEGELQERRLLAAEGFVSCFVAVDLSTNKIVLGPEIYAKAVAEDDIVFDEIKEKIVEALERAMMYDNAQTEYELSRIARHTLGSWVSRRLKRRPMLLPVIKILPA